MEWSINAFFSSRKAAMSHFADVLNLAAAVLNAVDPSDGSSSSHISSQDIEKVLTLLSAQTFDNGRMPIIKSLCVANLRLGAREATRLLVTFTFDSERMEAARLLYPRLVNPHMAVEMVEVFTFRACVEDFRC